MKSVWSLRRRWYSSAMGSLTLSSRSVVAQTSSAVARIRAPAETYSSSVIEEPTLGVLLDEDLVAVAHQLVHAYAGVMATRNSLFLTSRGMPTFTSITVLGSEGVGQYISYPGMTEHTRRPQEKVRQSQFNEGVLGV